MFKYEPGACFSIPYLREIIQSNEKLIKDIEQSNTCYKQWLAAKEAKVAKREHRLRERAQAALQAQEQLTA